MNTAIRKMIIVTKCIGKQRNVKLEFQSVPMEDKDHNVKNVVAAPIVNITNRDQDVKNVVAVLFVNTKEKDQNVKNVVVVPIVNTKE